MVSITNINAKTKLTPPQTNIIRTFLKNCAAGINFFILIQLTNVYYLPTEVTVVPLDGEICSNLGSIKGVKEEEDLCFCSVLLAD